MTRLHKSSPMWLWAGVIVLLNLWVFYPALFHPPRADQLYFLIETAGLERFTDIYGRVYSFCRTRMIYTGDQALFRPLLYAWLSAQKALFGYNFVAWQAAGLLLHLAALAQLGRLLHRMYPGRWIGILIAALSVFSLSSPLVIWHHLSGYLLFLVVLLAAMNHAVSYWQSKGASRRDLFWGITWLSVSCFLYEFGLVAAVILSGAHLWRVRRERVSAMRYRDAAWIAAAVPLYLVFSFWDYAAKIGGGLPPGAGWPAPDVILQVLALTGVILLGTVLFPAAMVIIPAEKFFLKAFSLGEFFRGPAAWFGLVRVNIFLLCAAGLLGTVAVISVIKRPAGGRNPDAAARGPNNPEALWMGGVGLALALGYALMLAVGRLATRSIDYLTGDLYHYYFIVLFLLLPVYAVGVRVGRELVFEQRLLKGLLALVLLTGLVINAGMTRRYNVAYRHLHQGWSRLFADVREFVAAHRQEPDFSFRIAAAPDARLIGFEVGPPGKGTRWMGLLSEFLYFDDTIAVEHPKYFLVETGEGLRIFSDKDAALAYDASRQAGR